jgi:hypothetical protein
MRGLLRTAAALGGVLLMGLGPATAAQNLGVYQTTDRKMDFELVTCGSSDKDLCVTLLAARGSAATKQVKPYIGKLVVNKAKAAGENTWRGTMRFGQYDLDGKMRLRPGKSFVISGCVYLVVCEDIKLIPAK